jgi:heptosyltransferase III
VSKGKILVIRGGAIGDFILTLPAIAALRERFPEAHIELLGYPHIAQLAEIGGLVNRVQAIEARALANFFARHGELSEDLRDYFSEFNIVVSYLYDPDEIFKTNVTRCLHGQFIEAMHRPNESEKLHATKVYLKALEERLTIFDADPVPRINSGRTRSTASPTLTLAVHPGSGSERKNWLESKWTQLLVKLAQETELNFLLVGGEAEGERLKRLLSKLPAERCELAQSLALSDLAARLQTCAAFIGHDSGITHLAAALGLPCVVLWADTIEEIWRPQGERVTIVKEVVGLHELRVARVMNEVKLLLSAA